MNLVIKQLFGIHNKYQNLNHLLTWLCINYGEEEENGTYTIKKFHGLKYNGYTIKSMLVYRNRFSGQTFSVKYYDDFSSTDNVDNQKVDTNVLLDFLLKTIT